MNCVTSGVTKHTVLGYSANTSYSKYLWKWEEVKKAQQSMCTENRSSNPAFDNDRNTILHKSSLFLVLAYWREWYN